MHYRCNRVYVPWVDKGLLFIRNNLVRPETQLSDISDNSGTIQTPTILISEGSPITESSRPPQREIQVSIGVPQLAKLTITAHPSAHHWVDSIVTPTEYSKSPLSFYCTGVCREEPERDVERKADVVSISASRDYQLSWENSYGSSMTEALITVLRKNPHSSLNDIMHSISYELHDFYMHLHEESRGYKAAMRKINAKRAKRGKTLLKGRPVETDNFQHPEISSHFPLDMNRPWPLKL